VRTMALARAALWLVLSTLACCVLTSKSGVAGGTRFNPAKVSFSDLYQTWNDGYKQSLYLTSQADKQRSAKELTGTGIAWQMLLTGYYETPPERYQKDQQWRADLATITGYLNIAEMQVGAGKLKEAHDALEPIRRIWLRIRERNGVPWFGDELTKFHEVMEPTVQLAVAGATQANVGELEGKIAELASAWEKVQQFDFHPASAKRQQLLAELMGSETQAVENLRNATAARDYANIKPFAQAVKRAFANLYLEFG